MIPPPPRLPSLAGGASGSSGVLGMGPTLAEPGEGSETSSDCSEGREVRQSGEEDRGSSSEDRLASDTEAVARSLSAVGADKWGGPGLYQHRRYGTLHLANEAVQRGVLCGRTANSPVYRSLPHMPFFEWPRCQRCFGLLAEREAAASASASA